MHDSSLISHRWHGRIRSDAERGIKDGWKYVMASVLQFGRKKKKRTEMRSWRGYKLVK